MSDVSTNISSAEPDLSKDEVVSRLLLIEWAKELGFGAVALGVAVAGVLMLIEPLWRGVGALLIIVAGVLGVLIWGRQPQIPAFSPRPAPLFLRRLTPAQIVSLCGMIASAIIAALAVVQWRANSNEPFGLAGWLWIISILLLALSSAIWPTTQKDEAPSGPVRRVMVGAWRYTPWGDLTVTPPASTINGQEATAEDETKRVLQTPLREALWTYWEVLIFACIILLAFALRLWELDKYPFAIHNDEILTGTNAVNAFGIGQQVSIFSTVWYGIDLPALWFAGVSTSLQWGGQTLAALRLPAALIGAATLFPLYGLVRGAWGRTAAIAASLTMAAGVAHVHYSRVTLNNIVTPFFWAACFYFLLRGLRSRHPWHWAMAGLMAGLGEYFYYGTRLLFILLAAFALYLLVVHWRRGWTYLWHIGALILGYLVAFGPLLAHFLLNPNLYFGRGGGVLTWNRIPTGWDDLVLMWNTLWPIMEKNLLTLSAVRANDTVYFAELMHPLENALLALGTALLVWRWRQPAAFLVLISVAGVLFVGGTLVPPAGNITHWTPAFPFFYAIVGVVVGAWAGSRSWLALSQSLRMLRPAAVTLLLLLIAWLNIHFYFVEYGVSRPEYEVRALQSRYQAALGKDYIVRNVGATWQPYDAVTNSYLLKGQDGAQITYPATELPLPNPEGKSLAFFFFSDNEQNLPLVRSLYPGGVEETVNSYTQEPVFKVYKLDASQARASYGPWLVVRGLGEPEPRWQGRVLRFGALPEGLEFPLIAQWRGKLYVETSGPFRLSLDGIGGAALTLDGETLNPRESVMLQPGWHPLVVEAQLAEPVSWRLMWESAAGVPSRVPEGYIWPMQDE